MTKEEQQARATLNDHIVIHKVTDNILAMHKDGTAVYAVDVIRKPLVRCKDCRWSEPNEFDDYDCRCHIPIFRVTADGFCSYGELMKGADDE